jgi:hypothetical protein
LVMYDVLMNDRPATEFLEKLLHSPKPQVLDLTPPAHCPPQP